MQYRFLLDGNLLRENPLGWDQKTTDLNRDKDIRGVLVNLNATLTFTSDGYDYLKPIIDGGYCDQVILTIQQSIDEGETFIERETALLLVSDMTEDEFNCSIQVKVKDNSFYGKINGRKKSEFYLTGDKTINAEQANITPVPIYEMSLFDPSTGVYLTTQPYGCYRVFDVLSYLVSAMTDNEVEFDSPVFNNSGDFANLMLTYGYVIRNTGNAITLTLDSFTQNIPAITFENILKELSNRLNLAVYIDNSGSRPKLIVDEWKELFRKNKITDFPNLPNLKTSVAKELIYSNLKIGGSKFLKQNSNSFPGGIRFLGFKTEQYIIVGKCAVDNTLDLSYNFVSDTNVIEEILILSGTNDAYDSDWFIIDADRAGTTLIAEQTNWLNPTAATPLFYNEVFSNYEISLRFLGAIPNTIAAFLGSGNNNFLATKTTFQYPTFATFTPILFQDDFTAPNFDPANRWDTGTSRYTAANAGSYSFELFIRQTNFEVSNILYPVTYYIERYDSLNNLIEQRQVGLLGLDAYEEGTFTTTFNADIGDYFIPVFRQTASGIVSCAVEARSYFTCTNSADGGGQYQTYDPSEYPIRESSFVTEIKGPQVELIRNNPLSLIGFYVDADKPKQGWISQVQINEFTGMINAKLLLATPFGVDFPPEIRAVRITAKLGDVPFTISPSDRYGNPTTGNDTIAKHYFFEVGKEVTISIPPTYLGLPVNPIGIAISIFTPSSSTLITGNTTITFIIESGANYQVQLDYSLTEPGDTYPAVYPIVTPPLIAGGLGSIVIQCESPSDPADYTFLWSPNGETTQGISGPAGDYTCVVTNINPGTFDNNSITFNIQIPISPTGE